MERTSPYFAFGMANSKDNCNSCADAFHNPRHGSITLASSVPTSLSENGLAETLFLSTEGLIGELLPAHVSRRLSDYSWRRLVRVDG
jgi:hypothetical protein